MSTATSEPKLNVGRNTLILAATMAVYSAVLQLVAAVSSITFVLVTGVHGLLGLGPAIFLTASAITALPAGRMMDRIGRRPVVASGYFFAAAGCALTALATNIDSTPVLILGFLLTGSASGIALLIRTAAGDMYPPEQRARGISYVLFGSVFGAILGPAVFGPLFAGRELDAAALTVPWLVAGAGVGVAVAPVFVPVPPVVPVAPVLPLSAGVGVGVASPSGVGVGVADADTSAAPFWCGTLSTGGGPGTSSTSESLPPQPGATSARPRSGSRRTERSRRTTNGVSAGARPCGGRRWGSR